MKGIKKINENVVASLRSLTIVNNGLPDNENWQVGTLKCDPTVAGLKYKVADNKFDYFNASYILQPNTVTSELIQDGTIRTEDLGDQCVTNDKIADRTIDHIKLKMHTITDLEMGASSVTNRALATGSVNSRVIEDESIQENDLGDNSVSTRCIQNSAVISRCIANTAVTETKLSNEAVSNRTIAGGAVTWDKMAPYTIIGGETNIIEGKIVQGRIGQRTITNFNIADYTITEHQLMKGAVTNRVLAEEAVTNDKIAPKTILGSNIEDGAISSIQIAEGGVSTVNYLDGSITKEKLAPEVYDVVDNAVVYDEEGNVTMLKAATCDVAIGSQDASGNSMKNGSLTVYGDIKADRVYNMAYADLAEGYIPGEKLEAGDVVELREDGKVYKSYLNGFHAMVVGVVSDEYAACYGASKEELEAGEKVAVALIGKVHVRVKGPVKLGDKIKVDNVIPGVGNPNSINDHVIGRALETMTEHDVQKVLCLIRPS